MVSLVITLILAFIIGFAAHRASICTVRAVAEVMSSRTGYMFASMGKTMLWIVAVTVPFLFLLPESAAPVGGWSLTATAVGGGFLFGIGAGINGACAYSTMARMVDGEGRMLAAIVGFAIGVFAFVRLVDGEWIVRPAPAQAVVGSILGWAVVLAVVLIVWCAYELWRLWNSRPDGAVLRDLVLARQYRLSTAALIIGVAGSGIFLLFGSPGYTSTFELLIEGALGTSPWPAAGRWLVLTAVLVGMFVSSVERGSLSLDFRPKVSWLRNLGGGVLMGLGVALAPGGNDALILYGIPTLSPHAIPAYLALAVGVIGGLAFMRAVFGVEMRVACRNDLYISG